MDTVTSYVENFRYVSGETRLSSRSAPFIGLVLYVLTISTLSRMYGTLKREDTQPAKIAAAKAQRRFYRSAMLLHNAFLCVGSFVMLAGMIHGYIEQFKKESDAGSMIVRLVCDRGQQLFGRLQFWLYVFYLSKFYEFLDTVFLCVTMRSVIPLHWIHHILTLIVAWIGLETKHTVMGVACVMNTAIHVVMYGYYAYKLIHPEYEPWWKSILTKIQMRQFMVNVVGLAVWTGMNMYFEQQCTGELWVIYVVFAVMIVFLGLFKSFAKKTYGDKSTSASKITQ